MGLVHQAIRINCDSQSAIFLAKNPTYHSKTKHIDVQYHFVRDMVEDKRVLLVKVDTLKNVADAFDEVCENSEVLLAQRNNGCCRAGLMNNLSCGPLRKENNTWENIGYVLYSFHD